MTTDEGRESSEDLDHVYFIKSPIGNLIKIGFTACPLRRRFLALSTGSPVPLVGLGYMLGGRILESELHRKFAPLRSHGEWFRAATRLNRFIRDNATPWGERRKGDGEPAARVVDSERGCRMECSHALREYRGLIEWGMDLDITYRGITRPAVRWCEEECIPLDVMKEWIESGCKEDMIEHRRELNYYGTTPAKSRGDYYFDSDGNICHKSN